MDGNPKYQIIFSWFASEIHNCLDNSKIIRVYILYNYTNSRTWTRRAIAKRKAKNRDSRQIRFKTFTEL